MSKKRRRYTQDQDNTWGRKFRFLLGGIVAGGVAFAAITPIFWCFSCNQQSQGDQPTGDVTFEYNWQHYDWITSSHCVVNAPFTYYTADQSKVPESQRGTPTSDQQLNEWMSENLPVVTFVQAMGTYLYFMVGNKDDFSSDNWDDEVMTYAYGSPMEKFRLRWVSNKDITGGNYAYVRVCADMYLKDGRVVNQIGEVRGQPGEKTYCDDLRYDYGEGLRKSCNRMARTYDPDSGEELPGYILVEPDKQFPEFWLVDYDTTTCPPDGTPTNDRFEMPLFMADIPNFKKVGEYTTGPHLEKK